MKADQHNDLDFITRFLSGAAKPAEVRLMRYYITKDAAFAKKIDQYRVLLSGLKELRIRSLEKSLLALSSPQDEQRIAPDLLADELELIERYFRKQLTPKELKAFEIRMKTDADFAAKTNEYMTIFEGFRETRIQELERTIREAREQEQTRSKSTEQKQESEAPKTSEAPKEEQSSGKIRRLWVWAAVAAGILLLITMLPYLLVSESSYQTAVRNAHQEQPTIGQLMSASPSTSSQLQQGIRYLQQKDYQSAAPIFSPLTTIDTAQIYLGHAYFGLKDFPQAIKAYRLAQTSKNSNFSDEADWFIVQSYLQDEPLNKKALEEALQRILVTKDIHNYEKKAKALKVDLDGGLSKWEVLMD